MRFGRKKSDRVVRTAFLCNASLIYVLSCRKRVSVTFNIIFGELWHPTEIEFLYILSQFFNDFSLNNPYGRKNPFSTTGNGTTVQTLLRGWLLECNILQIAGVLTLFVIIVHGNGKTLIPIWINGSLFANSMFLQIQTTNHGFELCHYHGLYHKLSEYLWWFSLCILPCGLNISWYA